MTGMMVRKMPANSLATSCIGPQVNWLSACTLPGVICSEITVMTIRPRSRRMPGRPTSVPATLNTTSDFHRPLISTRPTTPASSTKLTPPSKPNRRSSGVGSMGRISSFLW